MQSKRVTRSVALAAALALAGVCSLSVHAAPAHAGNAVWRLPATDYPHGAQIRSFAASNRQLQAVLGRDQHASYMNLGRINGRGWVQTAHLTVTTMTARGKHTVHRLYWAYAVSFYRNALAARAAVENVVVPMHPFSNIGDLGRIGTRPPGKAVRDFAVFVKGPVEVEITCMSQRPESARYVRLVHLYCGKQLRTLATVLYRVEGTPTATP